jgi:uncharacterized membrane-anchored protein
MDPFSVAKGGRNMTVPQNPADLPAPPRSQLLSVWMLVLGGLLIIAVLALIMAFNLYVAREGTSAGAILAMATSIIGALIGLIAPSPVAK